MIHNTHSKTLLHSLTHSYEHISKEKNGLPLPRTPRLMRHYVSGQNAPVTYALLSKGGNTGNVFTRKKIYRQSAQKKNRDSRGERPPTQAEQRTVNKGGIQNIAWGTRLAKKKNIRPRTCTELDSRNCTDLSIRRLLLPTRQHLGQRYGE